MLIGTLTSLGQVSAASLNVTIWSVPRHYHASLQSQDDCSEDDFFPLELHSKITGNLEKNTHKHPGHL